MGPAIEDGHRTPPVSLSSNSGVTLRHLLGCTHSDDFKTPFSSLRPPSSLRGENHLGLELSLAVPEALVLWPLRVEGSSASRTARHGLHPTVPTLLVRGRGRDECYEAGDSRAATQPPESITPPPPTAARQAHHLLSPAPPMRLQRCQERNSTCGVKEPAWDGCRLDTQCVFAEAELLRLGESGRGEEGSWRFHHPRLERKGIGRSSQVRALGTVENSRGKGEVGTGPPVPSQAFSYPRKC